MSEPRTLFNKIWDRHLVDRQDDGTCLIYIDRHLVHEVTTPQAFEGLRLAGRQVRRPDLTLAVIDHNIATDPNETELAEDSRLQIDTLRENCAAFGVPLFDVPDARNGICHVVGPEQGFTLPGATIVCGDSHTATHGAFGALAFGIGTSEVEHVLATQTAGGTGHVIEYAGEAIRALSMEGRMTVSNMTIEAGARAGLIAPDETTFEYLKGRPMTPKAGAWEAALADWRTLPSDAHARYDREVTLRASEIAPQVTWGTSPEDVVPVTGAVPDPASAPDDDKRQSMEHALAYMNLTAGTPMTEVRIDKAFIGSCTNGRIEDIRAIAVVAKGRKVAGHVHALVVPGSGLVKEQAEAEGLDRILVEAGFDWRDPGCSMCLAMNSDKLQPGERCAATSNRNFEGRQGRGGRTHLMSPAMAAAAAIAGHITDVRDLG